MLVTSHDLHFVMGFIKEDEILTLENHNVSLLIYYYYYYYYYL